MSKMSRSTRWCPTHEQLIILEGLYKGGLRTPKAPLIQKITAHLALYGKIEGKNVFYWFQNHKARDRQKLRKELSKQLLVEQHQLVFQEHQVQMNCMHANPLVYSHPHPPGFHQQHYQHGSPTFLHQSMDEEASTGGGYCLWKIDDEIPKTCDLENGFTRTCKNDCVMMVGHLIQSSNSNNNRPLQTLDLFPTNSVNFKEQLSTGDGKSRIFI